MDPENNLTNEIEALLAPLYPADQPGAAAIVVKDGQVLFRKGYGMANLELGVKVEPQMIFRLGSITKQFTAVCILMLYEQGELDLQDELTRFLPDYPTGGRKITIEHLLTHTSGIKSYTSLPEWLPLWRKDMTLDELIDLFKDQPFDFEPGEKFLYNNSGYILLGAIIEKVSGMRYAAFVQAHIFEPLGMTSSLYDNPERIVPQRVSGYSPGQDGPINTPYLSMTQPYAAGALASSVDDLARWDAALLNNRLIKAETLELAYRPYTLLNGESTGYGFGWGISEHAGMRLIEHGGGINGFTTGGVRIPSEKIYAAVLTNFEAPKQDPNLLAAKLAALASGHPMVDPTPIEVAAEILATYVGVYRINDAEDRIITFRDEKLFFQRTGGMRLELLPYEPDAFLIKDVGDRVIFTRDESGALNGLKMVRRLGPSEFSPRTDKPLPAERQAIPLTAEQLTRLPGGYELAPGFVLDLICEGEALYIQAPGQPRLQLFAAAPERLFAREVDLALDFEFDAQGNVAACTFTQGPQSYPLKKVSS